MWSNTSASNPASPTTPQIPSAPAPYKLRHQGRRFAKIVKLKPECVEKYKEASAKVWPEVLKQIKDSNIEDYSIFHDPETNILFASFKYVGYDYAGDMERMGDNPKVQEWSKLTSSFQESFIDQTATSSQESKPAWWKDIKEVFYTA